MFARIWLLLILAVIFLAPPTTTAKSTHDKDFWRAIAKNEGRSPGDLQPHDLAPELVEDLASPDSELRDVLAYDILVLWIYKGALTPDEVRPLMHNLLDGLRVRLGENGTDSVFRRSYSALILSVIAARNIDHAFLSPEEYHALLDAALFYLEAEKDVRGFDSQKGWMHSVAHTADLLKFLARDPLLASVEQVRLLAALHAKLQGAPTLYECGEDERLARIVISLARRDPPEKGALTDWVKAVAADATFPERPTPENLRLLANTRHLLTSLWAEMSVDERPSAGLDFLRADVREALRQIL